VAYTNSYIGTEATLLYDYDEVRNSLATQNPPNAGTLITVGSSGITVNLYGIDDSTARLLTINPPDNGRLNTVASNILALNPTDRTTDLDFYYDSTAMANVGYIAVNVAGTNNDNLYTINTAIGTLSTPARIGFGILIINIAVMPRYRGPVRIKNVTASLSVKVYPNPAGSFITVSTFNTPTALTNVVITDVAGRT
jgi:hypothetical protein